MREPLCDPQFWEEPRVFLSTGQTWKQRREGFCVSELSNHIAFVFVTFFLMGIVAATITRQQIVVPAALAAATIQSLPTIWKLISMMQECQEGFQDASGSDLEKPTRDVPPSVAPLPAPSAPADTTTPSARNPFMNVLVDEIKQNPTRPVAAPVNDPLTQVTLDDFFRTEFNRDPTDVFGRNQSQRQFVTMPSTGIPNDQGTQQDWLQKIPGKTCKEGGREACLPGTDGGAIPWLNVDR